MSEERGACWCGELYMGLEACATEIRSLFPLNWSLAQLMQG